MKRERQAMMAHVEKVKNKPKNSEAAAVEFRPPLMTRIVFLITFPVSPFLLVMSVSAWMLAFYNGDVLWLAATTACIYLLIAAALVFTSIAVADRLRLSSDGIHFHVVGHSGFVPWRSMDRLGTVVQWGIPRWGIVYKADLPITSSIWLRPFFMGRHLNRLLPLESFVAAVTVPFVSRQGVEQFKTSPLGEAIDYYAPWLFEEEAA